MGVEAEIMHCVPTTRGTTETPPDAPIVVAAGQAAARYGGDGAYVSGLSGACDLVHFNAIGASGVLGPGDAQMPPDEFMSAESVGAAAHIYIDITHVLRP
jgi:succinyl-diaminopimelate desuccinylase